MPNAANPQSLNRYSYVLDNPLRFTDSTGHIETDEADRALEIIATLETYGVYIEIDFFWLPATHPAPGEPSCNWQKGAWELSTVEAVLQGVKDYANALGGRESFKQAIAHGVRVEREAISRYTPKAKAEADYGTLRIFDAAVQLDDPFQLKAAVVHELAHAWDQEKKGGLSLGFEEATFGSTEGGAYYPGGAPPSSGATNRSEDWAYSSQHLIYGLALDNLRYTYVARQYPGVQRTHTWHAPGR